jgi:hypothetical protein
LKDISTSFYENSEDVQGFYLQISEAIENSSEVTKLVHQLCSAQLVSMQVRAEGLSLLNEVETAVADVTALLTPLLRSRDPRKLLEAIKGALTSGITFPKACFLAEAFNLASNETRRLSRFMSALQGFGQSFSKLPMCATVVPTCLRYPQLREEYLAIPTTETSKVFIELDKTFKYSSGVFLGAATGFPQVFGDCSTSGR